MAKDVSTIIKEATEAVKDVPDALKEVAFGKAFDALFAEPLGDAIPKPTSTTKRKAAKKTPATKSTGPDLPSLDEIDRTAHPEISHEETALRNSLHVLIAARDQLEIDGLTAANITRVLVDKFRCRISRQAVSKAMNDAGKYVNRHKEGNSVIFRIMTAGEKYLATPATAADSPKQTPKKNSTTKKNVAKTTKKKSGSKKPGPKTLLLQLISDGFFAKPQTIASIINHLKHTAGRTYKATAMSPTLLRLLRDKQLVRSQNSDNQYEYKNA